MASLFCRACFRLKGIEDMFSYLRSKFQQPRLALLGPPRYPHRVRPVGRFPNFGPFAFVVMLDL